MNLENASVLISGGASGLGLATARRALKAGAWVVLADLPTSAGAERAEELGKRARFVPTDVTEPDQVQHACRTAQETKPLRAVVHCAGRGATVRVLDREDQPFDFEPFEAVIRTNLFGTYHVLRFAAAEMVKNEPVDGERGSFVLTASVAAFEGQIGQLPYAASKAGIVGMTLVAARDLAKRQIRVVTIAPGVFDTPILERHPQEVKDRLAASIPHPARLGNPEEFAGLAVHALENSYLNGETIRLDGAVRMGPR